MHSLAALLLSALLAPAQDGTVATSELGYWNGPQWVALQADGSSIGVRFAVGLDLVEIRQFLGQIPGLDAGAATNTPVWLGHTVTLDTAAGTDAAAAWELCAQLRQRPEVIAASPRLWAPGRDSYYLTEEILLRWRPGTPAEARAAWTHGLERSATLDYAVNPGEVYRVPADEDALQRANQIAESGLVEFATPDFQLLRVAYAGTDDPLYAYQWHLESTGQGGTGVDQDIDVEGAWDITRGSANVTVAIVDTGVELLHPDLVSNLVPGIDVLGNDNDPQAEDGTWLIFKWEESHGTATSGVAAGRGDNGIGISGVAPRCTVMPVRFLSELFGPTPTVQDEADAFNWACANGASVINNSWGPAFGATLPASTKAAIDNCNQNGRNGLGAIVFFAAGNSSANNSNNGYASYSGVLGVTACSALGRLSSYSSFGPSVDCTAPSSGDGFGITTADRLGGKGYAGGDYAFDFGGTSSASPTAAGVMALILSANPALTRLEAIEVLLSTAEKIDPAGGNYDANGHSEKYGYGRVNAAAAVAEAAARAAGGASNTVYLNGDTFAQSGAQVGYAFTGAAPGSDWFALGGFSAVGTVFDGHLFDLSGSTRLLASGSVDAQGGGAFQGIVPPGLLGVPILIEVAVDAGASWQDSNLLLLRVQ